MAGAKNHPYHILPPSIWPLIGAFAALAMAAGGVMWMHEYAYGGAVFFAGSSDRIFLQFGIPYEGQVMALRIALLVLPVVVFFAVKRTCEELRRTDAHPLRGFPGQVVRRTPGGGYEPKP